jgi:rhodanese-related sulfurtransferase
MFHRRAFCMLAVGFPALRAQGPGPSEIKIDDLKQKYDRGEKLFYLDVREPKELEELGTLRGYVNIPMGRLEARLKEIPRDRPVVVF